jgi:deoxyribonuclease (pyrimidine dimer)
MVRVNVGIQPKDLTDEHLRAENVEIMMLIKFVEKYPDGNIPSNFSLNKGHISFFRDKVNYLIDRLFRIQREMKIRGMNVEKHWYELKFKIPYKNFNDYTPNKKDSKIIAERIIERIKNPLRKKNSYKWRGENILDSFLKVYNKYLEV